jgi:cell division protein FtsW (lipid II flippase)
MNASHSSTEGDKREKPFFSYGEALLDVVLIVINALFVAWLNLSFFTSLALLGLWILLVVIVVRLFRRKSPRIQH